MCNVDNVVTNDPSHLQDTSVQIIQIETEILTENSCVLISSIHWRCLEECNWLLTIVMNYPHSMCWVVLMTLIFHLHLNLLYRVVSFNTAYLFISNNYWQFAIIPGWGAQIWIRHEHHEEFIWDMWFF